MVGAEIPMNVHTPPLPSCPLSTQDNASAGWRPRWLDAAVLSVVLAGTLVMAGRVYLHYLEAPETLWFGTVHDRHTHYDAGLNMGLDLRHGDLLHFGSELNHLQNWGIVHALVLAVIEAIGGPDIRLAILPSLFGWVGTVLFGFLAARRLSSQFGNLAGLTAALFILASPAHQAFAGDVMLESLGACLTLACVYFYLVMIQDSSAAGGRAFGLALTLLFLTKYNYWLLVAAGLMGGECLRNYAAMGNYLRIGKDTVLAAGWFRTQLKNPIHWLLVPAFTLFLIGFAVDRGLPVSRPSKMWPHPQITLYIAHLLLLVRLVQWYYSGGREWFASQPLPLRQLAVWHILPMLAWFAWPKRLAHCIGYLSKNHGGAVSSFQENLAFYGNCLGEDYHSLWWSLAAASALVGIAVLMCGRMRSGGGVIVCCLALIIAINVMHHSKRSRFLHSWIAVSWVVAGAGAGQLLAAGFRGRLRQVQPIAAGLCALGLISLHGPGLIATGHAPEGGRKPECVGMLNIPRAYLPEIANERHAVLVANLPIRSLLDWTYLEYGDNPRRAQTTLKGLPFHGITQQKLDKWLEETSCSALVFVQVHPASALYEEYRDHPYRDLGELLSGQRLLRPERQWVFPEQHISVTLWKRGDIRAAQAK